MKSLIAKIESGLRLETYDPTEFEFLCAFLRVAAVLMAWTSQADLVSFHQSQSLLQLGVGTLFLIFGALSLIGAGGPVATILFAGTLVLNRQVLGFMDARPDLLYHHTTALAMILFFISFGPSFRRLTLFPRATPPTWSPSELLFLVRLLVVTIYLFASFHQLNAFFSGRAVLQSYVMTTYTGSLGAIRPEHQPLFTALNFLEGFFLLAVAIGLLVPRLRRPAIFSAIVFHIAVYPVFAVHVFSLLMIVLLVSFLSRDELHALLTRIRG